MGGNGNCSLFVVVYCVLLFVFILFSLSLIFIMRNHNKRCNNECQIVGFPNKKTFFGKILYHMDVSRCFSKIITRRDLITQESPSWY